MSDAYAGQVGTTAVQSSIRDLRSLPAPHNLPNTSRIAPTETTVFSVTAKLVGFKLEKDRDIHLVIADPSDEAVSSIMADKMRVVRSGFVQRFGSPRSNYRRISGTVTLTGVGFFDFLHGQTGVAPNGIELHPVLSIEFAR